jgi:hypothetical protein
MAFGPEYSIVDTDVHFGAVDQDVLDTHRLANERETQFLSLSFIAALGNSASLGEYLRSAESVSWAMFVRNNLAGLAIIHSHEGTNFNRTLVFEEHQGNGLAKYAHLVRMHHWLTERDETHLTSFVDTPNVRSRSAVERRGYYHLEDRIGAQGETYGVFQAVNPGRWGEFHRESPSPNATEEMCDRVSQSLMLARQSIYCTSIGLGSDSREQSVAEAH